MGEKGLGGWTVTRCDPNGASRRGADADQGIGSMQDSCREATRE